MIKEDDLRSLVCPLCKQDCLVYKPEHTPVDIIKEGQLSCKGCKISFPITDGVAYFMPPSKSVYKEIGYRTSKLWQNRLDRFRGWRKKRYRRLEKNNIEIGSEHKGFEERKRLFFEFCGEINGYILEIGCGGGWNKEFCNGQFFGIDPIVVKSGKEYDFLFCQGIGEFLPFRDNFFDSVTMVAMLDHVVDLDKSFKEVFRVLKDKGKLYIMTSVEEEENYSHHNIDKPVYNLKTLLTRIYEKGITGVFRSLYYRILYSGKIAEFLRGYTHTHKIQKEGLLQCIDRYMPGTNIVLEELPKEQLVFLKLTYERTSD